MAAVCASPGAPPARAPGHLSARDARSIHSVPARPSPTDPESRLATALRTASCGELTAANVGQRVVLTGWVARRRDYGKLIFIDLRDRYGLMQVAFDPERSAEAAAAHAVASQPRLADVLSVRGTAQPRLTRKE